MAFKKRPFGVIVIYDHYNKKQSFFLNEKKKYYKKNNYKKGYKKNNLILLNK